MERKKNKIAYGGKYCVSVYLKFAFFAQVGPNYKEDKELILYPNKGGKVADILEEAAKVVEMSPDGSGRLVHLNQMWNQDDII